VICIVTIAALLGLLVLVFHLPPANPPQRFVAQIQIERQVMARFWGEAHAQRILERALSMQDSARKVSQRSADACQSSALGM